jgi:hypothetical protein
MFDPDILDPLIKEHGIDKYGLIIKLVEYFILINKQSTFDYRRALILGDSLRRIAPVKMIGFLSDPVADLIILFLEWIYLLVFLYTKI